MMPSHTPSHSSAQVHDNKGLKGTTSHEVGRGGATPGGGVDIGMASGPIEEKLELTPMVHGDTLMVHGREATEEERFDRGGPTFMCLQPGGVRLGMVSCDEQGGTKKVFTLQEGELEWRSAGATSA